MQHFSVLTFVRMRRSLLDTSVLVLQMGASKIRCSRSLADSACTYTGGGYSERLRQIPQEIRQAVFERNKGLCRKCGAKGIQIDHICGNSNDMDNLQLLCVKCHN